MSGWSRCCSPAASPNPGKNKISRGPCCPRRKGTAEMPQKCAPWAGRGFAPSTTQPGEGFQSLISFIFGCARSLWGCRCCFLGGGWVRAVNLSPSGLPRGRPRCLPSAGLGFTQPGNCLCTREEHQELVGKGIEQGLSPAQVLAKPRVPGRSSRAHAWDALFAWPTHPERCGSPLRLVGTCSPGILAEDLVQLLGLEVPSSQRRPPEMRAGTCGKLGEAPRCLLKGCVRFGFKREKQTG